MDSPKQNKSTRRTMSSVMGENLVNANEQLVPSTIRQAPIKSQSVSNKAGQIIKQKNQVPTTASAPNPLAGKSLNDLFQVNTQQAVVNNMQRIVDSYKEIETKPILKTTPKSYPVGSTMKLSDAPKKLKASGSGDRNLDKIYNKKYNTYLESFKSDSWLQKATQTAEKVVDSFEYFASSTIARTLDVPDMLQSAAQLPSKYTIKDWVNTYDYLKNEVTMTGVTKLVSYIGDDRLSRKINEAYLKSRKKIELEIAANKTRESNAIKNGTLEQETEDYWNSNIVTKGMPEMMKTIRSVGKFLDPDEGMSSSALDYIEELKATNDAAFEDAYATVNTEKQDLKYKRLAAVVAKRNPNDTPENLNKRLEVLRKSVYNNDYKTRGLLTEDFDKNKETDKRTDIEKIFSGDYWNMDGSIESFNANMTDNIVQGLGQVASTIFLTKGLGAVERVGGAVAKASKIRGVAMLESEMAQAMKAGVKSAPRNVLSKGFSEVEKQAIKKFTTKSLETLQKVKTSAPVTKALETTKKGFSTITDKVNPLKNYFSEATAKLKKVNKDLSDKRNANKPLVDPKSGVKENAVFSTLMAFDESQQIGIDVYNKAIEEKIDKFKSKEEFFKNYAPADPSKGFTHGEIRSIEEDYDKAVEEFASENPDVFKQLVQEATNAGRLAASTNFIPEVLSNAFMFNRYFKSAKMVTRQAKGLGGLAVNNFITRGAKTMFVEGVFQEMGVNYYAQKKGEAYAKEEGYSLLSDFINKDVRTKEGFENLFGGVLMGGGQGMATDIYSGAAKNDFAKYGAYRDFMKDVKDLSRYTGKDELKNFVNLDLDAKNIEDYTQKTKQASTKVQELQAKFNSSKNKVERKAIKEDIKKIHTEINNESQKLLMTKINNSIHAGTTDKLIKTLDLMSKQEDIDPEDKEKLVSSIELVQAMEKEYVKHQGMKDSGTIISNRFTNYNNTKVIEDAKLNQQSEGLTKVTQALERQARLVAEEKGVDKNGKKHGEKFKKIYKETLDQITSDFKNGNLETDFNETDIREYNLREQEINELQSSLDRNERDYQELISEDYQEKFETKRDFSGQVLKHYSEFLEDNEKANRKLAKIKKGYSGLLSNSEMEGLQLEAKVQAVNRKAALDAFSELHSAARVDEEAAEILKAQEAVTKAKKEKEDLGKDDDIKSAEEIEAADKLSPEGSVVSGVRLSPEERGVATQRLTELSEKKELTPEEKVEEKDLISKENAAGIVERFDELLASKKVEPVEESKDLPDLENVGTEEKTGLDAIQAEFLAKMGIKQDPKFKPGVSTGESAESSAGRAVPVNTDNDEDVDFEDDEEDFAFSKRSVKESQEAKEEYKNFIDGVIGTIAFDEGIEESEVTARDVVKYLQTKSGNDSLENGWNIIEIGYKALRPEDTSANFDKLYNSIFTNHSDLLTNLLETNATDEVTTSSTSSTTPSTPKVDQPAPIKVETKKTVISPKEAGKSTVGEVTAEDLDPVESKPVVKVNSNDRVLNSGLSLTFKGLLQVHTAALAKLNAARINFQKLLDLKVYQDNKSNKVQLTVKVPPDYGSLMIYVVEPSYTRPGQNHTRPILFSAWEATTKSETGVFFRDMSMAAKRRSPLWLSNVPMLGYDSSGEAVMQLNNGDFAGKMDILEFPTDMPEEERQALIDHSNKANMTIRKAALEGKGTTITAQVNLMDANKENDKPQKLVSSEPKDSFTEKRMMVGKFDGATRQFMVDGKPIEVETINNNLTPFLESPHKNVIIRQVGVKEDGSPIYKAMLADVSTLSQVHADSVTNSILVYMLKYMPDSDLIDLIPGLKSFKTRLDTEGGIKLTEHNQLFNYLRSFITLSPFNAIGSNLKTTSEIQTQFAKFINNTDKNGALPGQPSIALINHKVVIAIKPLNGGILKPEDVIILNPLDLNPTEVTNSGDFIKNQNKVIQQLKVLEAALLDKPNKVNIKGGIISKDNKFFLYDSQSQEVEAYDNYDDFRNNNLEIPRPLGSAEVSPGVVENTRADGTAFTTMFGYYNFIVDSPELEETPKDIIEETKVEIERANTAEVVEEVIKEESEGDSEEDIQEKVSEVLAKIEKLNKTLKTLRSIQAPADKIKQIEDEIDSLKGIVADIEGDVSYSKRAMTEEQVIELQKINSELSVNVEGLTLSQQFDIIDNVFHRIASAIGYKKGNAISKSKILKDINTEIITLVDETISTNLDAISDLQELGQGYEDFIKIIEDKNVVLGNIKENWVYLEAEVLKMLEDKVGIKEVKNKDSKITDTEDTVTDENEENEELDNSDVDTEDSVEDGGDVDQRDKSFSSSNLEVKGKPSGSAKMKRFLAGIPVMLKDGRISKGFLDRVKHYDFLELDNLIKVALNSPAEIDSDYGAVLDKLEEIGKTEPWALAVLEKLISPATSEQARIEFLYNYTGRHALSSKFVEFVQTKNGTFTTRIIDANFNDVSKNIRETWKNSIKTQGVLYVNNSEGEYVPDMTIVNKLLQDFVDIQNMSGNSMGTFVQGLNYIPASFRDSLKTLGPNESITIPKEAFGKSYEGFSKSLKNKFPAKVEFALSPRVIVDKDSKGNIILTADKPNETQLESLSNWLNDIGLNLNASTLSELANVGLDLGREGKLNFEKLLTDPKSPFVNIFYNLENIKSRVNEKQPVDFESFSILENFNNRLLPLADVEAKFTDRVITKNFRDNGKLISGLPVGKFATDRIKELKGDDIIADTGDEINFSDKRTQLRSLSFSKSSLLLDLLQNDNSAFKNILKIHHIAVGSLKQKNSKFSSSSKVTQLTATDLEVSKLAHFFEVNNVPNYANSSIKGFSGAQDLRVGNIFLPTMSDKDQMMVIQNIIFKLKDTDYVDGQLSPRFLDVLYSQLVKPDLLRIHSFHTNGSKTDIKDYDQAAQLFNLIPSLNSFKTTSGENLTYAIKQNPSAFSPDTIESLYGEEIKKELNEFINSLVGEKISTWNKLGIISKNKIKVNSDYLNTRDEGPKEFEKRNTNIAAEFIINNLLTNANIHMAVIGDPALYSKNKLFNSSNFMSETKVDNEGNSYQIPDVTRPIEGKDANALYREWSETYLGTNLGKRLALMLAPGNKIFNSKNEQYKQINLEDFVDISNNLVDIVVTAYGENVREELQTGIEEIKRLNDMLSHSELKGEERKNVESSKKEQIGILQNKYPAIADYLEIESTDAQEYTTIAEHLHVMRSQGRIDDETMRSIETKLSAQVKDLNQGLPINKNNYLTKDELGFVMQPIKPVYTGQVFDPQQDVMRTVYIKTSSYPLLPQLTVGTQLDGLRVAMEKYESQVNQGVKGKFIKSVRASYTTGNKVGSSKNAISPFLPNGEFNTEAFTPEKIDAAALTLDRNNFRIQQDVPFKSDKGKEDTVSYGTQMLKLLFSNGILDVKSGFRNPDVRYNAKTDDEFISGTELFEKFNETFNDLVKIKRKQLYKELGLTPEGGGTNSEDFREKVEKLLAKEGVKRNYNKNELDSLKLDKNGEFQLPLYLNGQSSKIESLLLSIVTKRVIHHKFPGYSYIGASDAGFKFDMTEDLSLVEGSNRTIYLEEFEKGTGDLQGMTMKDGKINFAQIMVPSKFRNNKGELLDLYEKDVNNNYKYLNISEKGRYTMKPEMVEVMLMQLPTFRIPSSSHVSLSQVQIVGFLPPESGDMIVVPKNFTKQKGMDFDVDKENTYHLWTYISENGKIRELSKKRIGYLLEMMEKRHLRKVNKLENTVSATQEEKEYTEEMTAALGSSTAFKDLEELTDNYESMVESFKDSMEQKLLENKIIKIHSSVLSNSNPEVQKKITKVLSMDFAKSQAEKISALKELGNKNKFISDSVGVIDPKDIDQEYSKANRHFSILSESYQTNKMFLGSAGQSGIGVYSNFLTMASLMQQYGKVGNFALQTKEDGPLSFYIDGLEVNGVLGHMRTLDGSRTISEVFEELQNTATDNEKEQIMGRTGINAHTIGIFSLMSALGLDKTTVTFETASKFDIQGKNNKGNNIEMSLGNLILSQDIVKKYTDILDNKKSSTTNVDMRKLQEILEDMRADIFNKLKEQGLDVQGTQLEENDFNLLSGDNLVKNITKTAEEALKVDYQVLSFMSLMLSYADSVRNLQKTLNMSSNGLGLDLIEANDNLSVLKEVVASTEISNVKQLLFNNNSGPKEDTDNKDNFIYLDKNNNYARPVSPIGSSILNAFSMIDKTWNQFYPYTSPQYAAAMAYVMKNAGVVGHGEKKLKLERAFNKGLKKYLFANNSLFTDPVRVERDKMFFDVPNENESLASYLKRMTQDQEAITDTLKDLKNNPLIRKFTYDINKNDSKNLKNRRPSTIVYNIANSSQENEESIQRALIELIEKNQALEPRNGVPYTTRDLAQELIMSSYLEGGVQEIRQFIKYIPVPYLEVMGFTEDIRNNYSGINNILAIKRDDKRKDLTSIFVRQFFQHNPEFLPELVSMGGVPYSILRDSGALDIKNNDSFEFNGEELNQFENFLVIKEPTKRGKPIITIFEREPGSKIFTKIESLGFPGLSEYTPGEVKVESLKNLNDYSKFEKFSVPPVIAQKTETRPAAITDFGIKNNGSIQEVIKNIMNSDTQARKVIELFQDYFTDDIKLKVVPEENDRGSNGFYRASTNTITISEATLASGDSEFIAITMAKELVHAATMKQVSRYVNKLGVYVMPENQVPIHIRKLVTMFNELKKEGFDISVEKDGPTLGEFLENYKFDSSSILTETQADTFYGMLNIDEFMEMSLSSPEFRTYMDKIAGLKGQRSFVERLKEILKNVLKVVALQDNKTVSQEVVDTVHDIIFKENKLVRPTNSKLTDAEDVSFSMRKTEIEDLILETERLIKNNKLTLETSITEDPFKC